jgi:hypothetical protein
MRLSVFGKLVILSASTLDAETLVILPMTLAAVAASHDSKLPDDVFQLRLLSQYDVQLRYA